MQIYDTFSGVLKGIACVFFIKALVSAAVSLAAKALADLILVKASLGVAGAFSLVCTGSSSKATSNSTTKTIEEATRDTTDNKPVSDSTDNASFSFLEYPVSAVMGDDEYVNKKKFYDKFAISSIICSIALRASAESVSSSVDVSGST